MTSERLAPYGGGKNAVRKNSIAEKTARPEQSLP